MADKDGNEDEIVIWQAWVKSRVPDGPITYVGSSPFLKMLKTDDVDFSAQRPSEEE